MLLPGTLCDAELWVPQARDLMDVAIPIVGDVTRDDSIVEMARRVLEAAPRQFALAGLSMGGIVAFEVMRRASVRVFGLALLNTNPAAADERQIAAWREEIAMVEHGHFECLIEERWVPALCQVSGGRHFPEDAIRRMAQRVGPESYRRQLQAQIGRPDSWPSLSAIACPTLVLGGRQDTMCPPGLQERIAAAIPNAGLTIVEGCGHLSTLEQPEAVTARLHDWLEEVQALPRVSAICAARSVHA